MVIPFNYNPIDMQLFQQKLLLYMIFFQSCFCMGSKLWEYINQFKYDIFFIKQYQMSMIQLYTARFARKTLDLIWQKERFGTMIRFPNEKNNSHLLCFIFPQQTFKVMFDSLNISQENIRYPHGINGSSIILDFLEDEKIPMSIQIKFERYVRYLKNIACDKQLNYIRNVMQQPNSIYQQLYKYAGTIDPKDIRYLLNMNYFLSHYYLRLTAQTYCKKNGIKPNQQIDEKLKNQILSYIGEQYENHSPIAIKIADDQKQAIKIAIAQTKAKIDAIQSECQRKIYFYKLGAILVTVVHIVGFTYMIFFVDWLGWDIVQPLTYSVGVFYTLLGIRFYNKYRMDRNPNTIRQNLIKLVIRPKKLVELKQLKLLLKMHQKQLRRASTKGRILKNSINFRTSFVNSLNTLS